MNFRKRETKGNFHSNDECGEAAEMIGARAEQKNRDIIIANSVLVSWFQLAREIVTNRTVDVARFATSEFIVAVLFSRPSPFIHWIIRISITIIAICAAINLQLQRMLYFIHCGIPSRYAIL